MIRVLLAATYPVTRAGLAALLDGLPELEIAGTVGELAGLVSESEALAPDVILLDPGDDLDRWLEDLWQLADAATLPPIVMLVGTIDAAAEALRAGLAGFLLRDATPEELAAGIQAAAQGLIVLDRRAADLLATAPSPQPRQPSEPVEPLEPLTNREREVLQLIAQGLPNKAIAGELGISENTVKFHVGSLLDKLGAASRAEALARAARAGLIVL